LHSLSVEIVREATDKRGPSRERELHGPLGKGLFRLFALVTSLVPILWLLSFVVWWTRDRSRTTVADWSKPETHSFAISQLTASGSVNSGDRPMHQRANLREISSVPPGSP
jgi:hypothetical protein